MRKDRRHELQENELSTQLERVSETVKQNATMLTAIVGAAIVIVVGAIWFYNQKANAQNAAWSRLGATNASDNTPATELISRYETVAKEKVTPAITRSAWLKVGQTAVYKLMQDRDPNEAIDPDARKELLASAEDAFNAVVADPGNDITALGRALMGLGRIAEDRGDFDKAKEYYERVTSNDKLKETPIAEEAEYRLSHMEDWATMIEFPEPEVPPLIEAPEGGASTTDAATPAVNAKPMKEIKQAPAPAKSADTPAGDAAETAKAPAAAETATDKASESTDETSTNDADATDNAAPDEAPADEPAGDEKDNG